MDILSYRGPATPGGVSATLSRVIEKTNAAQQWWYLHGSQLRKKSGKQNSTQEICQIPFKIIEGHYRYCNNLLWPVLHELPQYASLDEFDQQMYKQLNKSFAWNVLKSESGNSVEKIFVNDYQLALCPQILRASNKAADIFWHIPWPSKIEERFIPNLIEIAESILAAEKIGFHIEQYMFNFLEFVDRHLPDYMVDFAHREVVDQDGRRICIVAHPLGIDDDYWSTKSKEESSSCRDLTVQHLSKQPFVLSVDRADYTKGVFQRLQAIEHYFTANVEQRGKLSFVQVCQKSRAGLQAFDEYWKQCRFLSESINSRWANENWQPIVWIETPVSANVLAWLYKRASIMLVTPQYDGLNLTAKEFSLCSENGVLILSQRAGVWVELADSVLTLADLNPEHITQQINAALNMSDQCKRERMEGLKNKVLSNTLSDWWERFGDGLQIPEKVIAITPRIHHTTKRERWLAK